MKKLLALCLAVAGLAGIPLTNIEAHEAPVPAVVPGAGSVSTLPTTARVNATVVVETNRRHRYHRRFRTVRRVYYRHGVKHVVVRRVYY